MQIIFLLVICSVSVALLFMVVFIWSVKAGQYDDTTTPAYRMLIDNPPPPEVKPTKKDSDVSRK